MSTWIKCEEIGHGCLACCEALRSVNLSGFAVSMRSIGLGFLGGTGDFKCAQLTKSEHLDQIDLAPLLNVPAAGITDPDLKKAVERVRSGGANDLPSAPKRRTVNLVAFKSKSRLGAMLASHFVPRILVLLCVAPPEFVAPRHAVAPWPEMGSRRERDN